MHLLKPRMSEKSFALSQTNNTFAIDVPVGLGSNEVAKAVESQFEVKVAKVRMVNRKGKVKRVINVSGKRSSNRTGTTARVRKAYVTLAEGSHLPFFAAEEKEIEEAKKQDDKEAKKADKKDSKDAKKAAPKKSEKETK